MTLVLSSASAAAPPWRREMAPGWKYAVRYRTFPQVCVRAILSPEEVHGLRGNPRCKPERRDRQLHGGSWRTQRRSTPARRDLVRRSYIHRPAPKSPGPMMTRYPRFGLSVQRKSPLDRTSVRWRPRRPSVRRPEGRCHPGFCRVPTRYYVHSIATWKWRLPPRRLACLARSTFAFGSFVVSPCL